MTYENMKDSGIPWIGKIPCDWTTLRLKWILSQPLQYGANEVGSVYDELLPRYIRITDITADGKLKQTGMQSLSEETANGYILDNQDILFARSGATVGKTFFYTSEYGRAAFAGYMIRAKINARIALPKYVYYSTLGSGYDQWKDITLTQATIQNIGANRYNDFALALPSLNIQSSIVSYLDRKCKTIDSIICECQLSIEDYRRWKASMIYQAVTKGLNLNADMRESGIPWIGKIPVHWKIIPLKYLCSMQAGKNLTSEEIAVVGDYPVYGGNGLRGFYTEFNNCGDFLLVGRQGALCGNVHKVSGKFWATEHAVVTVPAYRAYFLFLYYLLIGMNLNQYASNTAAQPGLSVSTVLNIRTVFPPIEEQRQISTWLDETVLKIDAIISEKESLIAELEAYKKSLIYETVTGKRKAE